MKAKPKLLPPAIAIAMALATFPAVAATPARPQAPNPNLNKVLDLKFTAVDGREVDLASLRGKVVLIDFWATWCGPCVRELPNVLKAYEKLHSKGFEIVGISLDSDKSKLEAFVKDKGMPWPQFFDGKGWKNELSTRFDIHAIPAMWLVDKDGRLASTTVRGRLEAEVEKYLKK